MKQAFTIYVPDDCRLKMINAVVLVEKMDGSTNGCTVMTQDKNDLQGDDRWLFVIDDKAKRVTGGDAE